MAKPSANRPGKGKPPVAEEAPVVANNVKKLESGDLKPLNFKVPPEFHTEFKTFASMHGMKMVELLEHAFELYKRQKGSF